MHQRPRLPDAITILAFDLDVVHRIGDVGVDGVHEPRGTGEGRKAFVGPKLTGADPGVAVETPERVMRRDADRFGVALNLQLLFRC
jgi:hypothetical protein